MDTLPGGNARGYYRQAVERRARLFNLPGCRRPDKPIQEPVARSEVAEEKIIDLLGEPKEMPPALRAAVAPDDDEPIYCRATCRIIFEHVAAFYGTNITDLSSHRKDARVTWPRHIAMYLARHLTLLSFAEIGRRLGGRDHTTIYHGAHKVECAIPSNAALDGEVAEIRRRILAGERPIVSVEAVTLPPPSRVLSIGKPSFWNAERKAELTRMWEANIPIKVIGKHFRVGGQAISLRAQKLGLKPRHHRKNPVVVREVPFS